MAELCAVDLCLNELSINVAKGRESDTIDTKARRRRAPETFDEHQAKRSKRTEDGEEVVQNGEYTAGKVKKIHLFNFMCHNVLEITLNENVNFIVGRNGSGKSAILTALTVGLGFTSRETSVKELIKEGKNSATVEITLVNKGDTAYKPDIYGDTITVVCTIKNTSSYKIKNWRGEIVSTERDELDSIVTTMNIKIDNPISVLNQDVLRTFLVTSKPDEIYDLFMKGTGLASIENNYEEAPCMCEKEPYKLRTCSMTQVKEEIHKLKENIEKLEQINELRAKLSNLEMELLWATAIAEENELCDIKEKIKLYENNLQELQNAELSIGTKNEEINTKIQETEQKILQTEQEKKEIDHTHQILLEKKLNANKEIDNKLDEIQKITKECIEIREKINLLYNQDEQSAKNKNKNLNRQINEIKRGLKAVEQQPDNVLNVFGPDMPRLLKRIEQEYRKKRFKEKPRGPIGAFIKLKDAAWAPAVENLLGHHILSSFCVDNKQDAELLESITKKIFYEKISSIISHECFDLEPDVRRSCTQSPQYSNLLDAMVIEDPVITNCLIYKCEIEYVLLIPTSDEAHALMSDCTKVPRNCKKALTMSGDVISYYPEHKICEGERTRAKYLHVSSMEMMQTLKEKLQIAEKEKQEVSEVLRVGNAHLGLYTNEMKELENIIIEKVMKKRYMAQEKRTMELDLKHLEKTIDRFSNSKHNLHTGIYSLKDQIKELTRDKEGHTRELQEIRQAIQCATEEFEIQKRAVNKATKKCPRINTTRLANQIKTLSTELRDEIRKLENQLGCWDLNELLRRQRKEMEEKYGEYSEQTKQCQNKFHQLRDFYSVYVPKVFTDILSLRQYKGTMSIDHVKKICDLRVNPQMSVVTRSSSTVFEKSYTTGVAFILAIALRNCINPLCFLHEINIFVDKTNWQLIMDILLDCTKLHPKHQFVFFIPHLLDTLHNFPKDYVTIHQLQPPERRISNQ